MSQCNCTKPVPKNCRIVNAIRPSGSRTTVVRSLRLVDQVVYCATLLATAQGNVTDCIQVLRLTAHGCLLVLECGELAACMHTESEITYAYDSLVDFLPTQPPLPR